MGILFVIAGLNTQAMAQQLNHAAPDEAIIDGVFHVKMTPATQATLSAADDTIERTGVPSLDQLAQQHQVDRLERIFRTDPRHAERHARWGLDRWYRVYISTQGVASARSAVQAFHEDPNIELAEHALAKVHTGLTMDPVVEALSDRFGAAETTAPATTSDPLFGDQWHYNNTGQRFGTAGADIQLLDAWAIETGAPEVIVQVVDSGMEITHPDLAANLWTNPCETENGQDDCGNGYVDDVYGYNFANDNADVSPHDPQDMGDSHGIHVAGTIAATTDNDIGVAGVAGGDGTEGSGVRIMTAQTFSDVITGFAEAIVYGADNGAVISNNSWGNRFPGFVEQAVLDAIDYFAAEAGGPDAPMQGGLVIFAAGNENATGEWYPAFYETAMAVGSTNNEDERSSFSNYGDWVEIAAPGGSFFAPVWSTVHTAIDGGYGAMPGTSMAAPHVAGVAALVASHRPGIMADDLRTLLTVSADDIVTDRPIGPRLNAFTALDVASTPPDAINDLAIVQPAGTVPGARLSLQWTATGAAGDRGQASAYDLRYSTEGPITTEADFEAATAVADLPTPQPSGTAESFTVEGLPFADEAYFSIRAVDLVGNASDLSNSPNGGTGSQPVASFVPDALAPTIDVNATKTITLEVRNEGPAGSTLYVVFEEAASSPSGSAAPSSDPVDPLIRSISPLQGEIPAGGAMAVELELDATAIDAGTYQRELAVTTNDPGAATQHIPVTITVEAVPPALAVEPATLDFGPVPRNGSDARALAVSNEGGDELIISDWTIDSEAFTLDAEAPIVLPFDAPAPEELEVVFAPDATGPFAGRVTFETNNPDAPFVEVDLTGEGVPSPELIATPALFDETVDFGTSVNRSLTVENAGDGDLQVNIVYAADGTDVSASDVAAVSATPSTAITPDSESILQSRRPAEASHAAGGADGAAAVESASPFVYQLDDGAMNRALTFGAGDIMWINAFESVRGATVITSLAAAWGAGISIGDPVELLLYDDPTNNGDPSDAELLEVVSTTIGTTTTNEFQEVAIPPTVVAGSFFVAALYRGDREGLNPAPLDEANPQGASWIAGSLFTGGIDIENPGSSDRGLNKIDAFGYPGNWLLRANGAPDIVEFAPAQATVGPDESTDIAVTLKGTAVDPGSYAGTIRLLSNDPQQSAVPIPTDVTVEAVPPRLSVHPAEVAFGPVVHDTVVTDTLSITNAGVDVLDVTAIAREGSAFALTYPEDEPPFSLAFGDTALVAVTFQPEAAGPVEGSLSLTHTGENESPLTVPLTGRAVPPVLTMSPEAFTDTTFTDEPLELEQQLTNEATEVASLVVELDLPPFLELGEISGTGVTVEGTQLTIAPLSNATVHYTFVETVSEATDFEGSVVLTSNDPERPEMEVPVDIHIPHPVGVTTPLEDLALVVGEAPIEIDTEGVFSTPPGETVTLIAESTDPEVVSAILNGQTLGLTPQGVGHASVTLIATAASGATGATTFEVAIERMVASASLAFGDVENTSSYRLVGLPGQIEDDLASTLSGEPGTTWRAFRETGADGGDPDDYLAEYDGSEAFRFGPGRGFWLLSRDAWAVEATVDAVALTDEGTTTVPLHDGWNILSNPLDQPVAWDETLGLEANSGLTEALWQWDGSWQPADTLRSARAGEAYYVFNDGGLEVLTLQHPATTDAGDPALVAAASPRKEALTLMAALETGEAGLQQIGQVTLGRSKAPQAHRLPPAHFAAGQLYAIGDDAEAPLGRLLHRTDDERDGHAYDLTLEAKTGAVVHLSTSGLEAFAGEEVVLVTPGGQRHDLAMLAEGETVRYRLETDTAQLQLLVGSESFIDTVAERPEALAFGPVYPNPSSGEVTAEVAVPEAMNVRVELFNVLGQQIALLHSGPLPPGVHELHWDGLTPGAGAAASGVYLLRLTGPDGQQDVTRLTRVR
ncbi:MAG: S8 family serine peptidase [Bacteroidetes bacterium]|jgi:subtilisin family serine protease|nr:S8 family serine peptidase [Bacteroidota bacterium]